MIKKIFSNFYALATILFVVGGLLIYQGEKLGSIVISIGLLLNVVFRIINLNKENLKALKMLEILRLCSAAFLAVTVILFFIDFNALEYVIVAIIFDVILNIDDLTARKLMAGKN